MKTLAQLNTYSTSTVTFTDEALGVGQVLANRYQINGLLDTASPVLENIEKICSAAGSWLSYDTHEGRWGVVINQTGTSVASFDDSNIIGNISVSGTGLQDLYNNVKVEFPHRELRDSADFVQIAIPSGDRNANEADNILNLSYDIINEPVQANLLGFIELKQSRVDLVINFRTDFSFVNLKAGDIVSVTESRFNFSSKLFRIVTITEVQDDDGALMMEITALEYDAGVYSTSDLYRYTRSDTNGIITIGSIGVPGTPQVTKYEIDARPRVLIESLAPTGVVEGLEYWLTNDFNEVDDANRSYTLIATKKPVGGGTYNSGDQVILDYDQLNTSNFYVKTRGFNATTVGPYSDASGLVSFTATQLTDAIGPNTKALNALGGLGTALGVLGLLKSVDELFNGDISSTSSIFRKVFELFEEVTGLDIIDDATSGTIGSPITIQDESSTITTSTSKINFVGDGVIATATGGDVLVQIGALNLPTITSVNPASGPTSGGTDVTILGVNFAGATRVTFDGITATNLEVISPTSIVATTPANLAGPASVVITTPSGSNAGTNAFTYIDAATGYISITTRLPPDRTTNVDPVNNAASDTAPITGSYFAKFGGRTLFGALTAGTGNATLYKSDGTLVETLTAAQLVINNNVVEFPFATRELGTDYYILLDEGVVQYCSFPNQAITGPTTWNFNTPLFANTSYSLVSDTPSVFTLATSVSSISPSGTGVCPNTDLVITYNRPVGVGEGDIKVFRSSDDTLVATIPAGAAVIEGAVANYGKLSDRGIVNGVQYYITMDQGVARAVIDCYTSSSSPSAAITKGNNRTFTTVAAMVLTGFDVESLPLTDTTNTKVNPQTNIQLIFNRVPTLSTGTVSIFNAAGALHQEIETDTSYNKDKTNELIWVSGNSVYVNPTKDLTLGTTYYVLMSEGAVTDSCRFNTPSITNNTTVRFTVDAGPVAVETPFNANTTTFSLEYDRDIEPGPGLITVFDGSGNLVATVASNDPAITQS
jgi:hypothetical protein